MEQDDIPESFRYEIYEIRKQALARMNLSPEEYETEILKIAKELGI